MPARETEAIILKTFPLGEADRLVSFLARTAGRMRGVARGARRLNNRFGSALEVLSHVQLWYVERETRDLVRIQQCELLESFHQAQTNYALSTGLAVVSEIGERVLPEREVSEPMFRLIVLTVREIERTGQWELPLSYFAFWVVRLGGWLPRFNHCSFCGTPFASEAAYYGRGEAGLLCVKCRRPGMESLPREARELAESFARARLEQLAAHPSASTPLREAALGWLEHHLERRLMTREFLESA